MADLIQFADFATLAEMIQNANGAVSGMSAAEAAAALGASDVSGLYMYNATQFASGASNIIDFPNAATAAEAFNEFLAAEGSVNDIGAAIGATGAAETIANMTVGQSLVGQAATAVYGTLSLSLPAAAAALAPLAGVSLGAGLYAAAPDFWDKLSRTLLPFCYDDNSKTIPVLVGQDGSTYFDKRLIDAFIQFIQDNKPISYSLPGLDTGNWPQPINVTSTGSITLPIRQSGGSYLLYNNYGAAAYITYQVSSTTVGLLMIFYPDSDPGYWERTRVDGTVLARGVNTISKATASDGHRIGYSQTGQQFNILDVTPNYSAYSNSIYNVAAVILYGDEISSGLPDDLTNWEGDPYPAQPQPINAYGGLDQADQPIFYPYYPVALPVGDPWTTSDPAVNPDPVTNPDPVPVVTPWINPTPNPNQYPSTYPDTIPVNPPQDVPAKVPASQPVPSPTTDPSQVPDPDNIPDDPESPSDPKDDGDSPPPAVPVIPILPSAASALLHVYNPNQTQLDAFGSWLWTTFSGSLIDTLSKLFNNPMDAVIGLHELYATPSTQGSATIRAGFLDSEVPALLVGERYTTINCGTVIVTEYWQNYLDYAPYTEVYIYLPFIGIVRVNANDIIGNAVNIKYNIDSYTGCCIALITVARENYQSTVYQFEGNCAVEIPITSGYQSALMSGLLAVASTAIGANPVTGMLMAGRGRGVNQVQHSGSFGSSYGAMGAKIPYIIIKRPTQKVVENYSLSYGYPAHKMVFVGNCVGYIRALEVIATSSTATDEELSLIISLLKEGVYVS